MSQENTSIAAKIAQLKTKIADIIQDDSKFSDDNYLLMWLKETKFDIDRTVTKIRESKKWRLETGVDQVSNLELDPEMNAAFPARYDGRSKDGYLVVSYLAGITDYRAAVEKYGLDKFFNFWRHVQAKLELDVIRINREHNAGKQLSTDSAVQGLTMVVDTKNFSIRQLQSPRLISAFLSWMRDTVTYYPGLISELIYINVGPVFKILLKLLIPILQSENRKVEVYGTDYATLNEKVFSRIDRDQILLCDDWK